MPQTSANQGSFLSWRIGVQNKKANEIQNPSYMVMAEIHQGGPMAHQLPLHNHRGGLVQPSLVMNHHHLDMDCHQTGLDIHATNISKLPRWESPGDEKEKSSERAKNQFLRKKKAEQKNIELLDTKIKSNRECVYQQQMCLTTASPKEQQNFSSKPMLVIRSFYYFHMWIEENIFERQHLHFNSIDNRLIANAMASPAYAHETEEKKFIIDEQHWEGEMIIENSFQGGLSIVCQ